MKTLITLCFLIPFFGSETFYDFKANSLEGKEINFQQFKGKTILVVNTASKCGNTPQYAELQKLHEQYGSKVVILGFPANNFGGQEPGTNQEIASLPMTWMMRPQAAVMRAIPIQDFREMPKKTIWTCGARR